MSEAPKICADCPLSPTLFCEKRTSAYDEEGCITYHPGPQCPFVRLDASIALNAEWQQKAANWMESPEAAQRLDGYRELSNKLLEKDAENERLRYRLKATAEKYHARADHGGLFDECTKRTCMKNDKALRGES